MARSSAPAPHAERAPLPADSATRPATASGAGTRPLDILFLLNSLAIGGSERKVMRLIRRLHESGVRTAVACLNGPYTLADTLPAEVPFWCLGRSSRFSLAAAWRLRGLVTRHRPATLVSVNLYPSLYALACAASIRGAGPRTVGLINSSTFVQSPARQSLYRTVLPLLRATVHGSQTQRESWFGDDAPAARRSSVIYNGVDTVEFDVGKAGQGGAELRARNSIPPERFVFGSVGRLAREKNQLVLLDALQRLRAMGVNAHVLLAGEGPMRPALERRAAELDMGGRVTLLGAVSDVRPVLSALDVFVLPSVETFSNAALEAMAMSRPVLLNDAGGAREMIDDAVQGFVIAAAEMHARLPALLAQLCANPRRCARLGQAARQRVEQCFSLDAMVTNYRKLLCAATEESRHV